MTTLVANSRQSTPSKSRVNLEQLYQLLIQPVANVLPKDPQERVIFIPQQALFLVSFPDLRSPEGKYLIKKHTIVTSPSIQVLYLTRQKQEKVKQVEVKNVVVVGNLTVTKVPPAPRLSPELFPGLPRAEKEASRLLLY